MFKHTIRRNVRGHLSSINVMSLHYCELDVCNRDIAETKFVKMVYVTVFGCIFDRMLL